MKMTTERPVSLNPEPHGAARGQDRTSLVVDIAQNAGEECQKPGPDVLNRTRGRVGTLSRPIRVAWCDFGTNDDHRTEGENHVLIRVVGGTYATGGFFLSLAPDDRSGSD